MTTTQPEAAAVTTPGRRIHELDALRGFALCGILVINIYQQLIFLRGGAPQGSFPPAVELLFFERFMPIFAVLFGAGFGLFLDRAGSRTDRPRVVLARRLAVLLVIGVLHFLVHPGEVLTSYALGGLVVLLPLSLLGPGVSLAVAAVLLLVGPQLVVGYGMIPGLLALGFGLARLGVPEALHRRTGRVGVVFTVAALLASAWIAIRLAGVPLPFVNVVGGLGGGTSLLPALGAIVVATAYASGFLLLLRVPGAGGALSAVLAPMGRMALTNYLAATALFLLGGTLLGIDALDDAPRIALLTVAILAAQAVWSPLWLRRFRFGPVEWAWRCLTWWRRAPLRRAPTGTPVATPRAPDPA